MTHHGGVAPARFSEVAELLGVPAEDRARFRRWSDAMMDAATEMSQHALTQAAELYGYFNEHLAVRREQPGEDPIVEQQVPDGAVGDGATGRQRVRARRPGIGELLLDRAVLVDQALYGLEHRDSADAVVVRVAVAAAVALAGGCGRCALCRLYGRS